MGNLSPDMRSAPAHCLVPPRDIALTPAPPASAAPSPERHHGRAQAAQQIHFLAGRQDHAHSHHQSIQRRRARVPRQRRRTAPARRRSARRLTTNQGVPIADNQNSLRAIAARADAAGGLHPPREDHPLRPRAHPRAHRARARLGRARLLRADEVAVEIHDREALHRSRRAHAGVHPLLDRRRRRRLGRHAARRARLRGEVLHAAKATSTWSATTSRCSSSRTRSSSRTSCTR